MIKQRLIIELITFTLIVAILALFDALTLNRALSVALGVVIGTALSGPAERLGAHLGRRIGLFLFPR